MRGAKIGWRKNEWGPEKFLNQPLLEARKLLVWKPYPLVHPKFEVKNSQCKFKRSRPPEIFQEIVYFESTNWLSVFGRTAFPRAPYGRNA